MDDYARSFLRKRKKKALPKHKKVPRFLGRYFFKKQDSFSIKGRFARWQYAIVLFFGLFFLLGGIRYWWKEMRWRYIVLHHTASDVGSLAYYRRQHEERWGDVAYHIIINNGSQNTAVGQIEYSQRWHKRQHHYSTRRSYLNYFGIAIAIVGDFEKHPLPHVQKQTLLQLLINLSREYDIPPERVIGHREIQNTKCPGRYINMLEVREALRQAMEE